MAAEKEGSSMAETQQGQAPGVLAGAAAPDEQPFEAPKPQKSSTSASSQGPEGGYDDTPIPRREVQPTRRERAAHASSR